MYVLPYWSYNRQGAGAVLTNHITNQTISTAWDTAEQLQALYSNTSSAVPQDARDLEIVFSCDSDARSWLNGRAERNVGELPKIEQIELTNRCPYTCQMCPRTEHMDRSLGDMSLDLFASIMDQVQGHTRFCALHHFGESLLHRGLPDAVKIALDRGVRTGLSCNPPSLKPKRAQALLEAGLANMVLSLDSLDPEAYRLVRGTAARVDLAESNLRELVRLRDAGGHDTNLTLQMISMWANQSEAERFLKFAADVGVDRAVVIRLERWDFDDTVVAELGEHTSAGYTAPCNRPWQSVAILWDGRVVPCCHDYNGEMVLGDLRRESLEEIWDKPVSRTFRDKNFDAAICGKCAFSESFRERRRQREGFWSFHKEVAPGGAQEWEWINPRVTASDDLSRWYDGFDILTTVERQAQEPGRRR